MTNDNIIATAIVLYGSPVAPALGNVLFDLAHEEGLTIKRWPEVVLPNCFTLFTDIEDKEDTIRGTAFLESIKSLSEDLDIKVKRVTNLVAIGPGPEECPITPESLLDFHPLLMDAVSEGKVKVEGEMKGPYVLFTFNGEDKEPLLWTTIRTSKHFGMEVHYGM